MKAKRLKSGIALCLTFCMTVSSFAAAGPLTVHAEALSEKVSVTQDGKSYTIGNKYLTRTFSTEGNVLKTEYIKNYRTDGEEPTVFTPAEGSAEFVIATLEGESKGAEAALDRTGWSVTASSAHSGTGEGPVSNVLDGDDGTIWHTPYDSSGNSTASVPYYLILDLGSATKFSSIGCTPRSNGSNGRFGEVEVYLYDGSAAAASLTEVDEEETTAPAEEVTALSENEAQTALEAQQEPEAAEPETTEEETLTPDEAVTEPEETVDEDEQDEVAVQSETGEKETEEEAKEPVEEKESGEEAEEQPEEKEAEDEQEKQLEETVTEEETSDEEAQVDTLAENGLTYDGIFWGTPVKTVTMADEAAVQYIDFDTAQTATKILLKINSTYATASSNADKFGTLAELDLYSQTMGDQLVDKGFTSDDLEVKKVSYKDVDATVNKVDKTGVELTVEFEPYTYNSVEYTIREIVTMYDGDSFMRKHLEISVPESQAADAGINYIDLENMQIADEYLEEDTYWTIPDQADNKDMASMPGEYLELGQPYYMAAMYWGCEFPQTENKIRDGKAFIRYHYGKTLAKDAYFEYHKNNTAGQMTTWDVVVGAARSTDYSVVQADFYEYIETIATDTDFRQQYNSWYDNMKDITKENLETSFFEIEKGFTQHGVNPLDSYVADDGWVNYSSFWDFDTTKFPNELYDASLQASQMGSNFGLWLGPRGGYGTETTIANWIKNNGFGSVNRQVLESNGDINISDARYLNKLRDDIFIGYQNKFDINYWKLDGMLQRPSTEASVYYTTTSPFATITETYERWTDLFEDMRDSYEENHTEMDPVLWLNMTSYTNPSPWHVQWVNSVWMQNTGDTGYNDSFDATDEQSMLTYRDNSYYNFLKERQWQLPNKYFYNHDPVYGLTANDAYNRDDIYYTTEEMRDHLYMLGTRGTAFWEYYYSYSMFDDEKWDVNAEAANWIEENFDILQKSQMIGGKPGNGDVYGYSCWNGSDGIVSLRNPNNVEQTYTLTFDRLIGVAEGTSNVYGKVIVGDISYQDQLETAISYGDTLTFTLPAKEVLIIQYGEKDTTAATIDSVHAVEAAKIEVEFNETIRTPEVTDFTVEGNTVTDVTLNADLRTAVLTLEKELEATKTFTVKVSGVKDTVGNVTNASLTEDYYQDEVVTAIDQTTFDGTKTVKLSKKESIDGKEGFTVIGQLKTSSKNAVIAEQSGAYEVSIDKDGYLEFTLSNGLTVNSKYTAKTVNRSTGVVTSVDHGIIADGAEHKFAAVKEINGMIKLYIDGTLVASSYDEEKVNPELEKGAVTIGEALSGTVKYIDVLDTALAYDEVAAYTASTAAPVEKIPTSKLTATASAYDSSESATADRAIDGDENTYWATPAGGNVADHYLQLELDEVSTISRVDYTKRKNGDGWDATGNLLNYIIEVSKDGSTWTKVAEGNTVDGTTQITFDAVEAKYVRLKSTKSYHWQSANTVMAAAEVAVYKEAAATVDKALLTSTVNAAKAVLAEEENYTAQSFAAFKKALEAAEAVLAKADATVTETAVAVRELREAQEQLELAYYTVKAASADTSMGITEIDPETEKYAAHSDVTVKAFSYKGYHFVAWKQGDQLISDQAAYTFQVTGNLDLTAVFEKDQEVTATPSKTEITVTWPEYQVKEEDGDKEVQGYYLYIDGTLQEAPQKGKARTRATLDNRYLIRDTSYTATGLTQGTEYTIKVDAVLASVGADTEDAVQISLRTVADNVVVKTKTDPVPGDSGTIDAPESPGNGTGGTGSTGGSHNSGSLNGSSSGNSGSTGGSGSSSGTISTGSTNSSGSSSAASTVLTTVVTTTQPTQTTGTASVKTGDTFDLVFYSLLTLAAAVGFLGIYRKKNS